jgi:hypothetical protein
MPTYQLEKVCRFQISVMEESGIFNGQTTIKRR